MVEQDRARGRAEAWRPWVAPWVAAGRRPALAWSDGLSDFARRVVERIRAWIAVEVGPGRLVPWLAIAHSAAASRSISPSTESRRHGRRASCSQRRWRRPSYRGTDRLRFPWRWAPLPWQQGWRPPP